MPQPILDNIAKYSKEHWLNLNGNKIKTIFFGPHCNKNISHVRVNVYDAGIDITKMVKNVGLYLDNDLRFRELVEVIIQGIYETKESIP